MNALYEVWYISWSARVPWARVSWCQLWCRLCSGAPPPPRPLVPLSGASFTLSSTAPPPPPMPPCNDGQHTCPSPASTLQTDRCFVVPSQCACTNHAKQKLQRCRIVWIDCKIILIILLYCYIKSCVNCKGISRSRKRVSVINPKLMTASCHFWLSSVGGQKCRHMISKSIGWKSASVWEDIFAKGQYWFDQGTWNIIAIFHP